MFRCASSPRQGHVESPGVTTNRVIDGRATIGVGRCHVKMADLGRHRRDTGSRMRHSVILPRAVKPPLRARVHCSRDRNCLRLMKIGVISCERPDTTERSLFCGSCTRAQTVLLDGHRFAAQVPGFRQDRSARARDVQDRGGNRWQDVVNTAITDMSTTVVRLAEADRFGPVDIPRPPSSGRRMP